VLQRLDRTNGLSRWAARLRYPTFQVLERDTWRCSGVRWKSAARMRAFPGVRRPSGRVICGSASSSRSSSGGGGVAAVSIGDPVVRDPVQVGL
jgi:hypothetical protein